MFGRRAKDNFDRAKQRMLKHDLRARGIRDPRVLAAMLATPREEFVPENMRADAYGDCARPIGEGQTISQPFTVAFMAEAAGLQAHEKVLEVGAGSGYGAAVLAQLAEEVHTIERIPSLAIQASNRLQRLGYENVEVHIGDGSLGLASHAPYDAIVVTAGGQHLPPDFAKQLREGGRIVIPMGDRQRSQRMYRYLLSNGELERTDLGAFAFVPLIGDEGWEA